MSKFNFKKLPTDTKARYQGAQIQAFRVAIPDRNASIQESSKFLDSTMANLFKQYKPGATSQKMFRTMYKLSDGRWYSSKFFFDKESDFYPDLTDAQYNVDHTHDLVEHININMVEVQNNKITKYMK